MKLRAIAAVAAIAMALSVAAPSATFAQANGSIDIFYVDPMSGVVDLGACQGAAILRRRSRPSSSWMSGPVSPAQPTEHWVASRVSRATCSSAGAAT